MNDNHYGYIYKITIFDIDSALNEHYYIGQHYSSKFDENYWGSGTEIINYIKYKGTTKLKREVLEWAYSAEELNELESKWIYDKWYKDPLCMNRIPGGNVLLFCDDKEYKQYLSEINSDLKWYNNGKECVFTRIQPEGFIPGRINVNYNEKASHEMSKKGKGRKWYNNGKINIKVIGDPPEGFIPGIISNLSEENKQKLSNKRKNAKYYYKGILQIRVIEPPDDTWIEGKLYNKIPDDWKYYNNGKFILRAPECPEGFKLGKIPRNHKKKN